MQRGGGWGVVPAGGNTCTHIRGQELYPLGDIIMYYYPSHSLMSHRYFDPVSICYACRKCIISDYTHEKDNTI